MARRQLGRLFIAFLIVLGFTAPGLALVPQSAAAQCSGAGCEPIPPPCSICEPVPEDECDFCTPSDEETPQERIQRIVDERRAALEARLAERQAERHARLCEALPYLWSCT